MRPGSGPGTNGAGACAPLHFLGGAPAPAPAWLHSTDLWEPKHHSHWCARLLMQGVAHPSLDRFHMKQISTPLLFFRCLESLRAARLFSGLWSRFFFLEPPPPPPELQDAY